MNYKSATLFTILLGLLTIPSALGRKSATAQATNPGPEDILLRTMEKELHRGQSELAKQDPAPYFASYNVTDGESMVILSAQGAILNQYNYSTK